MRLSKTTNDAVRILVDCAQQGDRLVKVATISDRLDITPQNTFKIVHLLSRAGFVSAVRGRYGGVKLSRPAEEIRVGQVVRAIEETAAAARRERDLSGQDFDQMVGSALDAFIDVLDAHTVADMAKVAKPAGVAGETDGSDDDSAAAARREGKPGRKPAATGRPTAN